MTTVTKVAASIDYLTCSLDYQVSRRAELYAAQAFERGRLATCPQEKAEPAAWFGFRGKKAPSLFYGTNDRGALFRASGQAAAASWRVMDVQGLRVSRLDFALTFWLDQDDECLARDLAKRAAKHAKTLPEGRRPGVRLLVGFGGGDTLYIGSRKSDQLCRLYDKGRESGSEHYTHAWRAETEFHNSKATWYFRQVAAKKDTAPWIQGTVEAYYLQRGILLPTNDSGAPVFPSEPTRDPTDIERSLNWLATQVGPSLKRLLKYRSRAQLDRILWDDDNPQ